LGDYTDIGDIVIISFNISFIQFL